MNKNQNEKDRKNDLFVKMINHIRSACSNEWKWIGWT